MLNLQFMASLVYLTVTIAQSLHKKKLQDLYWMIEISYELINHYYFSSFNIENWFLLEQLVSSEKTPMESNQMSRGAERARTKTLKGLAHPSHTFWYQHVLYKNITIIQHFPHINRQLINMNVLLYFLFFKRISQPEVSE